MKVVAVILLVALMGNGIVASRGGPAIISNEPRCVQANNDIYLSFADPNDCSCFYQCAWPDAYKHCCPADNETPNYLGYLVYNPLLEVCDRLKSAVAAGANCPLEPTTKPTPAPTPEPTCEPSPAPTPEPTPAPTPAPTTISTAGPGECCACPTTPPQPSTTKPPPSGNGCGYREDECPTNNEYYHSYPHETCANKWCQCDWGHAVIQPCPANLVFNGILQVCDWPTPGTSPNLC